MDQVYKKTWLKALRSGDYKQGRGHLRSCNAHDLFCCLGVLIDVVDEALWVEGSERTDGRTGFGIMHFTSLAEEYDGEYKEELNESELSEEFMCQVGFDCEEAHTLITMNDGVKGSVKSTKEGELYEFLDGKEPKDFAVIADWIEEKL